MELRHFLKINFNIGSMEEYFLSKIFLLNLMAKTNIGLQRGGQVNLCVITEVFL